MRQVVFILIFICQSCALSAQDWQSLGEGTVYSWKEVSYNYDVFQNGLYFHGYLNVEDDTFTFSKWDGKKWTSKQHLLPPNFNKPSRILFLGATDNELIISSVVNSSIENVEKPIGTFVMDTNENLETFSQIEPGVFPQYPRIKWNDKYYSYFPKNDTSFLFQYNNLNQAELILKTACGPQMIVKVVNNLLMINADTFTSFGGCFRSGPSYFEDGEWKKMGEDTQVNPEDFAFFKGKYYLSALNPDDASPDPNWSVQVFDSVAIPLPGEPVEQWMKIGHPDMYTVTQIEEYKGYLYALNQSCVSCTADKIYRYNGDSWEVFKDVSNVKFIGEHPFTTPSVRKFKFLKDELYVFGRFDSIGNLATKGMARTKILNQNNFAPNANNDTLTLFEDNTGQLSLTANDTDPNGDYIITQLLIPPTKGAVEIDGDENLIYSPNPNFHGLDSVQYEAYDRGDLRDTAWVYIQVTPVVDSVVCKNDTLELLEDSELTFYPTQNDIDIDSLIANLTIASSSNNANLVINEDLSITINPQENFWGIDSFTYQVCDTSGNVCDSAKVLMNVLSQNDKPVIENDTFLITDTGYSYLDVLSNDFDVEDGTPNQEMTILDSANFNASFIESNQLVYYRTTYPQSVDTVIYKVCDSEGACDSATVIINNQQIKVLSVNNELQDFSLLPHPVKSGDLLQINSILPIQRIEVFSFTGQQLKTVELYNNEQQVIIHTNQLRPGIFVIKLITELGTYSQKLIVN